MIVIFLQKFTAEIIFKNRFYFFQLQNSEFCKYLQKKSLQVFPNIFLFQTLIQTTSFHLFKWCTNFSKPQKSIVLHMKYKEITSFTLDVRYFQNYQVLSRVDIKLWLFGKFAQTHHIHLFRAGFD